MKIKKIFTIGLAVLSSAAPISIAIACSDKINHPKRAANKDILAGFSHHADILLAMGIKPKFIADKGMGSKVPYLEKIDGFKDIEVVDYINTFGTIDPIQMQQLAFKVSTVVGSYGTGKLEPYFKNVFKLESTPAYTGKDKEKIKVKTKEELKNETKTKKNWQDQDQQYNYTTHLDMEPTNIYGNWINAATKMDFLYSYQDKDDSNDYQYRKAMDSKIKSIRGRINLYRNELSKIVNNKTLLIYSWGGRTTPNGPVETDLSSNDTGSVMLPNLSAGSIFYSKKNGLGFNLPKFNEKEEIYIQKGSWNSIEGLSNGRQEIKHSLEGQNDYVIFSKQIYDGETTSISNVRDAFGKFVKNKTKINTNLKWFKDASMGTASYGPNGVEYILDWVKNQWNLSN